MADRTTPAGSSADAAVTSGTAPAVIMDKRRIISGFALVMLAAVIMFFLDAPWDSVSTFKISRPRDNWAVGNLVLPSQLFNLIAAIILAFLGTRLFLRGGGRWTGLSLGIGLVILAMAFSGVGHCRQINFADGHAAGNGGACCPHRFGRAWRHPV